MTISFFNLNQEEEMIIRKKFKNCTINFFENSVNKTDINSYKNSNIICICPKSNINSNIIKQCKNLKYIVTRSTGIDHIDKECCIANNIKIKNAVNYGNVSVAEYQFALLLNLTRKINLALENVRTKGFVKDGLQGTDLYGKTLGIIGYGNIGKRVEKIAKAFNMNVLINTRSYNSTKSKYVSLDELLKKSDIISINVPLTEQTFHMINKNAFEKMKKNVIIINTSRGKVIDTASLIEAIKTRKVKAVALDVIEGEKYIKGDFSDISEKDMENVKNNLEQLKNFDNVIISPHNAYNSVEAVRRIFEETIENINSILEEYNTET